MDIFFLFTFLSLHGLSWEIWRVIEKEPRWFCIWRRSYTSNTNTTALISVYVLNGTLPTDGITVKNCPEKLTELLIYPRWFLILAINVLPVPILLLLGTGRTDNIDEVFVFCNELVSVFVNSFFDYYLRLELIFFTPVRNNYSPCSLSYSTINRWLAIVWKVFLLSYLFSFWFICRLDLRVLKW